MSIFQDHLKTFKEFGVVEGINLPVVRVKGLPHVRPAELVIFDNDQFGQTLTLHSDHLEILLFSSHPVAVGTQVTRTGQAVAIGIGDQMLGSVYNPLAQPLSGNESQPKIEPSLAEIDIPPLSITKRYQITEPLLTGVSIVDLLLPLGKGQRELVIGNRKTGKTSFLLSVIKNQVLNGSKAIYVGIGKQNVEIEIIRQWLAEQQILNQVSIISASSQDSQSLIYLAPFTGMTLAEYLRDQGNDVLLVLDDLSTHAKFYREISLLAKKFPGRDSYPGDIFYTHARLLERAGNFIHPVQGTVGISCLPVAETVENDLTDYIVSNLIGITDGHLLFDSVEFLKGRRPAINPSLSVTRVGRQTQSLLHQDISQLLMAYISDYQKNQQFAHFGAELTKDSKELLNTGEIIYKFFNQSPSNVMPLPIQLLTVSLIWSKVITEIDFKRIDMGDVMNALTSCYQQDKAFHQLVDQLIAINDWVKLLEQTSRAKEKILTACKLQ